MWSLLYLTATGGPPWGGGVYVLQNIPPRCPCFEAMPADRLCLTNSGSKNRLPIHEVN